MATTAVSKVSAKSRPEPKVLPQPAKPFNTQPDRSAVPAATAAPRSAQNQEAAAAVTICTPAIMNTTLDLLENSDADLLVEPQGKIDDVSKQGYSWCTIPVKFVLISFCFDRL